jgi:hypothetical protein
VLMSHSGCPCAASPATANCSAVTCATTTPAVTHMLQLASNAVLLAHVSNHSQPVDS